MLDLYEPAVILLCECLRSVMYASSKCVLKIICEWRSDTFPKAPNLKREV